MNLLIKKTIGNETVVKSADKGSIISVMSPDFYLNMCKSHLQNEESYECIQDNDPSPLLEKTELSIMGTIFAVVGSNLTVTYFEVKMFALLPQTYPRDFVVYFVHN